ncbi:MULTISPECIES: hypothetical protein [Pseudoalteromonas]|uniref:Uncharacterized protein n=1 Tax=Pseudoalteromonas luteoviolacea (strain 2ta16) TaxID=1353533 RepID=V4HM89_PSEL2|nr:MULTISPECIES: hypothetical protein [Pseudoalteromonas]ESP90853.1 hypothetical protein PL2TA16_01244 [Pseudoalteromonas luteoviolacea 2ta16]KZN38389.1 hypothetical protein N483_20750 [Pseudoalteromonas luteoviolacea NCIMB 1944]MCG7547817.1 hypothetical protein [Pseudoalteromonas sp. Of7M-16]
MKLNFKKSKLKTLSNDKAALPTKATRGIVGGGRWISFYNECDRPTSTGCLSNDPNDTNCTTNTCA